MLRIFPRQGNRNPAWFTALAVLCIAANETTAN
jgi:hypothetical protein